MPKVINISRFQTYILFALIFFLMLSGFLSPFIIENKKDNWNEIVESKIADIEKNSSNIIYNDFEKLVSFSKEIKNDLSENLSGRKSEKAELLSKITSDKFQGISIQLYAEDSILIAWNNFAFKREPITKLADFEFGEVFFNTNDLITYLTIIDTINSEREYELIIGMPIQKHYHLDNEYYEIIDLKGFLSSQFFTPFKIEFNPGAKFSLDGREYSFEILNNYNNKIGVVTFTKPSLVRELNRLTDLISSVQAVLVLMLTLLLGTIIYRNKSKIQIASLRIVIFSGYLVLFRALLFLFKIPNKFIYDEFTEEKYFSSEFAFGIVGSPLDLFLTVIVFAIICYMIFQAAFNFSKSGHKISPLNYSAALVLSVVIFLGLLRGFGASIRSVIFDSTLRYFSDVAIIPDYPILLMEISILVLAVCSIAVSISIILWLVSLNTNSDKKRIVSRLLILLAVFQAAALIYDLVQNEPQGTPLLRVAYITLVFLLSYFIQFNKLSLNYIFIAITASILSISYLNYYNTELEKKLLRNTALKLIRPNETLVRNIITESLNSSVKNNIASKALDSWDASHDASSFIIWSRSQLYYEGLSCEISFLDTNKIYLGGYAANFSPYYRTKWENYNTAEGIFFQTENLIYSDSKIISGITPVWKDKKLLGYLSISVLYDVDSFEFGEMPEFLMSKQGRIDPAVDFAKINFFDFHDKILVNELSDFSLSKEEMEIITNAEFSILNEAWLSTNLKNEQHRVYVFKHKQADFERILAVAMREKEVSMNLYEFFKVFFIQSLLILSGLVIFLLWGLTKEWNIKLTFKARLLLAFLIISIIPLVLLAGYFRILTEEKNSTAILYKLGKRAFNVESYINDYLSNSTLNLTSIFDKANRDLGINFSIFKGEKLFYSSQKIYYDIGLIPNLLNPTAYNELILSGAREFVLEESIEKFGISSFYYRGYIGDEEYIFKVDDVFNPIQLPMSDVEINIFLFGSYSLAVILITILSTIIANQIASPIKTLTGATRSVAGGDLNIEVVNKSRGEIGELVSGFNMMVKELKKSQAELAELERETAWKEMAKQVAHEIKNPLTPMKLSVQQLAAAHKDKSPKFEQIFEKVTSTLIGQIETLKNIATEFSNFARMPKMNVVKVDLNEVIDHSAYLFANESTQINIKNNAGAVKILADEDQLRRTIINLIRNSIQARAQNINFSITAAEGNCFLRISDNGVGMPHELKDKIFENNFTTKLDGMGIGLTLAKKYVENIHGSIKIEETSEKGTTVLIIFPVAEND